MAHELSRPCPACGEGLELDGALVTCPTCDRDFSVARTDAGPDPYRDAPLVALVPAARPPPAGAAIHDSGNRIAIGRGAVTRRLSAAGRGVGLAVVIGPPLLLRLERAPGLHVPVLAGLFAVWATLCLAVWGAFALARITRREELWLEEGVIGWRRARLGIGPERLAFVQDIAGIELRRDGPRAWVEVGFRTGETWAIGRAQHQGEPAMSWLARRLYHATRPL